MWKKKNVHVQFVAARHPLSDIDTNVLQAQKSTLEFVWCGTLEQSDDAMKTPSKAKITHKNCSFSLLCICLLHFRFLFTPYFEHILIPSTPHFQSPSSIRNNVLALHKFPALPFLSKAKIIFALP